MAISRRSFVSSGAAGLAGAPGAAQETAGNAGGTLRVAACQILTFPEPRRSAEKICSWLEKAARDKIDVVAFPEAAVCGYACDPAYWRAANPAEFQAAEETVLAAARKLNVAVILGTAHWEEGQVFNSVLVADKGGVVRGRYAKTFRAEQWPAAGRKLAVWTVAGVKSCFIICHDVRYPELVRLPAAAGAQICYFVSNESGLLEEHKLSAYRAMPIARATENSIYLVMANAPANPDNLRSPSQSHGNSKIIHPDGNVLVETGFFKETLVAATIDLSAASRAVARRAVRESVPVSDWLREGLRLVEGERA